MDDKKVSFSFNKLNKKTPLLINKESSPATNKEFIKCLESHEIKLLQEKPTEAPLVIPLKENYKTSRALASLMKRRAVLLDEDDTKCDINNQNETSDKVQYQKNTKERIKETLEERAAREILNAATQNNSENLTTSNLVLPIVHADNLPLDGAQESTLDDYERIPVFEFGKAMLRGMGWVEPPPETTKNVANNASDTPIIRPKGMGLGADKMLKPKPLLIAPEPNEVLEIKRNAFVRIIGGKYKDLYGQIEGFDDYAGRIIVKMAIGNNKEAFNEFLCQPVSAKEYNQYGKCINNAKYEEYKRREKKEEGKHANLKKNCQENSNNTAKPELATRITEKSSSNDMKHYSNISKSSKQSERINRKPYEKKESYQATFSYNDDCHINQNISDSNRLRQKLSSCVRNKNHKERNKNESDNEVASLSSSDDDKSHDQKHHHHRKHKKRKSKKSKKQRDRSRSTKRN